MAETKSPQNATTSSTIDPKNGYCSHTKTYHSLRPAFALPLPSQPLSSASYALSLLRSPSTPTSAALSSTSFLIESDTGRRLTYSEFLTQVTSLSSSLRSLAQPSLSKTDVAFVLCPPSFHVPVLIFALLSLGISVSFSNPLSPPAELAQQIQLSNPSVAFTVSAIAGKLPPGLPVILLDSPMFLSMLESQENADVAAAAAVDQSDPATILYSSGTTGRAKAVVLTHRNLIAAVGGFYHYSPGNYAKLVTIFTLPLFHVFGFFMLMAAAARGGSLVLMGRFDLGKILEAVEKYRAMYVLTAPPVAVAMASSDLALRYDLSSLKAIGSGGGPLGKEVTQRFKAKFPHVDIFQGYGMTETAGAAAGIISPEEAKRYGSAGRLSVNILAKIIDPDSGEALPPGRRGELWLQGPVIMKGYALDEAATSAAFDSQGWLKTGDLCYFDSDGFLFIVDRLKELIKYKGYQVPPIELEEILRSMPEIADAAVIPYSDEEAGQIPLAYVVRKPGSTISATQIMDSVAKQVAPYKKIRRLAFIDSIPKSPAGKILRRELINHSLSTTSKL